MAELRRDGVVYDEGRTCLWCGKGQHFERSYLFYYSKNNIGPVSICENCILYLHAVLIDFLRRHCDLRKDHG